MIEQYIYVLFYHCNRFDGKYALERNYVKTRHQKKNTKTCGHNRLPFTWWVNKDFPKTNGSHFQLQSKFKGMDTTEKQAVNQTHIKWILLSYYLGSTEFG